MVETLIFALALVIPLAMGGAAVSEVLWRVSPRGGRELLVRAAADSPSLAKVWLLGTVMAVGWVGFYAVARISGALPSPADWAHAGYRHGPWDATNMLFLIPTSLLCLGLLLPAVALLVGLWSLRRTRRVLSLAPAVFVAICCGTYGLGLAFLMYWTVD